MLWASSAVPKGVAMGEYAAGITFETNSYSYVDGGQTEISIVYPSSGTFTTPEYSALVKGGPAGEDAKKAIDALLSKESQIELLKVAFRRPITLPGSVRFGSVDDDGRLTFGVTRIRDASPHLVGVVTG